MSTNLSLRSLLDSEKLSGPNFESWFRRVRIVLEHERILYVMKSQESSRLRSRLISGVDSLLRVDSFLRIDSDVVNSHDRILDRFHESLNFEFKLPRDRDYPGRVLTYLSLYPCQIFLPKSLSFSLSRDRYERLYDGLFVGSGREIFTRALSIIVLLSRA